MIIKGGTIVSCGWQNSKLNLHLWCQFRYFQNWVSVSWICTYGVNLILYYQMITCRMNLRLNLHLWCIFLNFLFSVMILKWPLALMVPIWIEWTETNCQIKFAHTVLFFFYLHIKKLTLMMPFILRYQTQCSACWPMPLAELCTHNSH